VEEFVMKKLIMVSFVLLFFYPKTTFALKCVELPSIESAYEKYDAVIIGYVDGVVRNTQSNQINLRVIKSFKGTEESKIAAEESIAWGTSKTGEEYLYFLIKTDKGWEIPLCSPMMAVADASEELVFLQDKEIPLKNVSVPKGSVVDETPITTSIPTESNVTAPYFINWTAIVVIVILIGVIVFVFIRYTLNKRNL
jgi:hypothetical protein